IRHAPQDAFLQHLVLGGEVFTAAFAKEILSRVDVESITNLYGQTEATIDASGFAVKDAVGGAHSQLGRPLSHYHICVLVRWLDPCTRKVVGVLFNACWRLALCYFGGGVLTAD